MSVTKDSVSLREIHEFQAQKAQSLWKVAVVNISCIWRGKGKNRGISEKSRKIVINRDRAKLTSLRILGQKLNLISQPAGPAVEAIACAVWLLYGMLRKHQ